jgi:predicted dienelactone hydrolase
MMPRHRPLLAAAVAASLVACTRTAPAPAPPPAQQKSPDLVGLRPDAPAYAKHGPFWVGTRDFKIPDAKRPIPLTVWYPALNPAGAREEITYTDVVVKWDAKAAADTRAAVRGHAINEAAGDMSHGPYPLIVFSHGYSGARVDPAYLTEHLASHGFIVVAPDHTEQWADDLHDLWKDVILRPQDVLRVIGYAELLTGEQGVLRGLIDMQRIGVAGHSQGGYTALAAAGARYSLEELNARCAALRKGDPSQRLCTAVVPREADMAALAGLNPVPHGLWPAWTDSRIRAVASFAGDSWLFGTAGLAAMRLPLLAIGGDADTGTPLDWGIYPAYEHAASLSRTLVVLEQAGHMIFVAKCDDEPLFTLAGHPEWCSDAVWDMDRAHDLVNHFTTAFMLDTLKGDKDAHAALLPGAVTFTGVRYETTMR